MERIYVSIPETPHITHFTSPQLPAGVVIVNTAALANPLRFGHLAPIRQDVLHYLLSRRGQQPEESFPDLPELPRESRL